MVGVDERGHASLFTGPGSCPKSSPTASPWPCNVHGSLVMVILVWPIHTHTCMYICMYIRERRESLEAVDNRLIAGEVERAAVIAIFRRRVRPGLQQQLHHLPVYKYYTYTYMSCMYMGQSSSYRVQGSDRVARLDCSAGPECGTVAETECSAGSSLVKRKASVQCMG